ncbi:MULTISPECIES: hypothetical protein [unclassified Corynebacterium]|uniref:hypothetical protein n=1 Tax=unclassified Corynebacterium TaxID=2624378 RepID=UPI0034CFCC17
MTQAYLCSTHNLVLSTGFAVPDFHLVEGLNLLHVSREASATVLGLTLAGRMKKKGGEVRWTPSQAGQYEDGGAHAAGVEIPARKLFSDIAYAGTPEIDGLERLVPVRAVVREQLAWTSPWYRLTPRKIMSNERVQDAFSALEIDLDEEACRKTKVGELDVLTRLKLRVALALISRPEAVALVIDDVDQLRSWRLREDFLATVRRLADRLPVVCISANADTSGFADHEVRIHDSEMAMAEPPTGNADGEGEQA